MEMLERMEYPRGLERNFGRHSVVGVVMFRVAVSECRPPS